MIKKLLSFFAVLCYAAADDKNTPPATVLTNVGATNVLLGLVGTTKFKNLIGQITLPYSDSVCGRKTLPIGFCRATPVGDADYASLAIGSIMLQTVIASEAVTSMTVWIKQRSGAYGWDAINSTGNIAVYGSDGAYKSSYYTVDAAIAALATGDILKLKAGEYTLADAVDITAVDCSIIGEEGTVIVGAADADYCLKTVFGAITSTKSITIKNITFDHGDDATQQGLVVDNVGATGRINVYLKNVSGESDGGDTLHVTHTATAASIRLYVGGGVFEGPVNFVVGNTDDRIRFEGSTLRGGLVTGASATAMEIELWNCKILHEGITGGNNAQLIYAMYCLSETDANPNVYAALNTDDLAGSHNETVLFPIS